MNLVDPDGMEAIEKYDGWKVDKQNRTITRINNNGGDRIQCVEGDGVWQRAESRAELLKQYEGYTVVDNLYEGPQISSSSVICSSTSNMPSTIMGTAVGLSGLGCKNMAKTIFDPKTGTYLGKDGTIKNIKMGKNGGLNGRYKTQIELSSRYSKYGRVCKGLGIGFTAFSFYDTEKQARKGLITPFERFMNHAVEFIGLTPVGSLAPLSYELGKKYGPSTWGK